MTIAAVGNTPSISSLSQPKAWDSLWGLRWSRLGGIRDSMASAEIAENLTWSTAPLRAVE